MNHSETELMNVKTAFKCPQSVLLLIPPSSQCFLSLVSFIQWLCMSTIFRNIFYLPVPVLKNVSFINYRIYLLSYVVLHISPRYYFEAISYMITDCNDNEMFDDNSILLLCFTCKFSTI